LHARPDFWNEARSLLNWGFRAHDLVRPIGTLVGPVTAAPAAAPAASSGHTGETAVLLTSHHGGTLAVWQLALLAGSAAVAVTVTARRQRRRSSGRLSLPPL
ncbi:MAG: hypothetical protein JO222_08415, partial [Frankiales bacterium]|nr:hypothetical protein [Frankiales bacterium]